MFFWSIPLLFIIDNVIGMLPTVALLDRGIDENYDDYAFAYWPIELQIANTCFLLAHWVFSV